MALQNVICGDYGTLLSAQQLVPGSVDRSMSRASSLLSILWASALAAEVRKIIKKTLWHRSETATFYQNRDRLVGRQALALI